MPKINRAEVLAEAVASAFERAGYTPQELLQGPIKVTDLAWQAPPLRCEAPLAKVPLHEYLDYPLAVHKPQALDFYRRALSSLLYSPEEAIERGAYKGLVQVMPNEKSGFRNLALPVPEGWPKGDPLTGAMFAMEMARLLHTSLGSGELVCDSSNYFVDPDLVGVRQGEPIDGDGWNVNCSEQVLGLLEKPRGMVSYVCAYDTVARLRSALHEEPERVQEFEAVDYALQALRIMADGNLSRELQRAVEGMSLASFKRKQRLNAFRHCLEVMQAWQITDRAKISTLLEILVPAYYSLPVFCRKLYNVNRTVPAVLFPKVERKIINTLKWEVEKLS